MVLIVDTNNTSLPDLNAVLDRLQPLVRASVLAVLRRSWARLPADLADDATQEALIALWRHWGQFTPARGTREAWAAAVARHKAIDEYRRWQRHAQRAVPLDEARDATTLLSDDPAAGVLRRVRLAEVWPRLTVTDRQCLALMARGYVHTEIAAALGWPLGTVKTRLHSVPGRVRRLDRRLDQVAA